MQDHTELRVLRQDATATSRAVLGCLPHADSEGAHRVVRSLYIHVPFCFHKCHYCDFYSIVDSRDRQIPFVERLAAELRAISRWARGETLETIFVGGGTPSLLRPELWRSLLETIHLEFRLSPGTDAERGAGSPTTEFTVECNPETVTPALMAILFEGGVNRVSMGAQTFDRAHLKTLERWHDPESVPRAIEMARSAGIPRQSIDLIYAIPGQTMESLDRDIDSALALGTEHVSAYTLTYEPGTAMTARLARGAFTRADEDLEADMFEHVATRLGAAGLDRYEVSNFAKPGAACRHNMAYWRQREWLAAGPSASGHVAGHRWKNVPRLDEYLSVNDEGYAPIIDHERPDSRRALGEMLMTGVRLAEGVGLTEALARADAIDTAIRGRIERVVQRSVDLGHLMRVRTEGQERVAPTRAGFSYVDGIARELIGAIEANQHPTDCTKRHRL